MQNNKKGPREGSMKARSGFHGHGKARDLPALGEKPKALRGGQTTMKLQTKKLLLHLQKTFCQVCLWSVKPKPYVILKPKQDLRLFKSNPAVLYLITQKSKD